MRKYLISLDKVTLIPYFEIVAKLFSFITVIILVSILSIEDYGHYSFTISLVMMLSVIMDGGINNLIFNYSLYDRLNKIALFFVVRNYLSFFSIMIFIVCIYFFNENLIINIIFYSITTYFISTIAFFKMIVRGQGNSSLDLLTIIIEPFFRFIILLIFWLLKVDLNIEIVFVLLLGVSFFSFLVVYRFVIPTYDIRSNTSKKEINFLNILNESIYYLLYYLALIFIMRSEIFYISNKLGIDSVAYYSSALNIYFAIQLFFRSLINSKMKKIMNENRTSKLNSIKRLCFIVTATVFIIIIFSQLIFSIIYPISYFEYNFLLQYIIIGLPFYVMTNMGIQYFNIKFQTQNNFLILSVTALLKLILFLSIEFDNLVHFAYSFIAFEIFLGVLYFIFVLNKLYRIKPNI
jgi:O-antigen/teichoic acid export membrane protein